MRTELPTLNAEFEFEEAIKHPVFCLPTCKGDNLLIPADEPFSTVCVPNLRNYLGMRKIDEGTALSNVLYSIVQSFKHTLRSNVIIIFNNGFISKMYQIGSYDSHKANSPFLIRSDLFVSRISEKIFGDAFNISCIENYMQKLFANGINFDEFKFSVFITSSIAYITNMLSCIVYDIINEFCLDTTNNVPEEVVKTTEMSKEELATSTTSLNIQWLLTAASNDIQKVAEVAEPLLLYAVNTFMSLVIEQEKQDSITKIEEKIKCSEK